VRHAGGAAQTACQADRTSQACYDAVVALHTCSASCLETRNTDLTACRTALQICRTGVHDHAVAARWTLPVRRSPSPQPSPRETSRGEGFRPVHPSQHGSEPNGGDASASSLRVVLTPHVHRATNRADVRVSARASPRRMRGAASVRARCRREEEIIDAPAAPIHRRLKAESRLPFQYGKLRHVRHDRDCLHPTGHQSEWDRWTLELSVPYIRVSGGSTVVSGPVGRSRPAAATRKAWVTSSRAARTPSLARRVDAVDRPDRRVKFPTASRSKGLGTGEFDGGIEPSWSGCLAPSSRRVRRLPVSRQFGGGSAPRRLARIGGRNVPGAGCAAGRPLPRLSGSGNVDERHSPRSRPFVSWTVDRHWSVDTYVSAGLASGSPRCRRRPGARLHAVAHAGP